MCKTPGKRCPSLQDRNTDPADRDPPGPIQASAKPKGCHHRAGFLATDQKHPGRILGRSARHRSEWADVSRGPRTPETPCPEASVHQGGPTKRVTRQRPPPKLLARRVSACCCTATLPAEQHQARPGSASREIIVNSTHWENNESLLVQPAAQNGPRPPLPADRTISGLGGNDLWSAFYLAFGPFHRFSGAGFRRVATHILSARGKFFSLCRYLS